MKILIVVSVGPNEGSMPTSTPDPAVGDKVLSVGPEKARLTKLHPGVGDSVHLGMFADRRATYAMFREEGWYLNLHGARHCKRIPTVMTDDTS